MNKNLLSKNISSNVQENTPNGVVSSSSFLYNIEQNIYKVLDRPTHKSNGKNPSQTELTDVQNPSSRKQTVYLKRLFSSLGLALAILVQLVLVERSHAQCYTATNGLWPSTTFTPTCNATFANITTAGYASEYSNVNLVAGTTYTFRSSVTTDYITVDNNGAAPLVGVIGVSGTAGINWTCTATGTYRFYTHTSSACGASTISRTRSIRCGSVTPPANDACAAATSLPCGTSALAGTTVNSVSETAPNGCGSSFGVWYTFTGDGQQTTITSTTTFDHELTISSGACGALTNIACVDNSTGTETYTFNTVNGTVYRIYVAHYAPGNTTKGTFTMSRTCTSLVYDPCAVIPTISGCGTSATASMTGSGAGWSVTSCGFATPGQERLFSFTAPTTGTYTLNLTAITGGFVDFFWKAASGGCNAAGWNCIDDISATGTFSAITPMSFTAGTTYYILLDPEGTGTYSATFNLGCPVPAPANDLCSGATSVTCGATVTVNTANANTDAIGSTTCGTTITTPGVWYQIAGNGQVMTISTVGLTATDTKLIVYSGSCAGLTCVGGSDDFSGTQSQITWSSVSGTTYYVLAALFTGTGSFPMSLSCVAPCTGTPNPGATTATSSQVFAGGSTTLGVTTAQTGTGISYQWQSGPSASGPWSPIVGANSSTYLASPTTATYYQCVVTCSNGGASGTSTPILISVNPYCNPDYTGYTTTPQNGTEGTVDGDMITNVTITLGATTLLNNSSTSALSTPQYTFYSSLPTITMFPSNTYNVNVTAGTFTDQNFAVWIDYNNDNDFYDAGELIGFSTAATTIANQTISFPINLACAPPLGTHRMRVRDVYATAGNTIDPCTTYGWGETEDYLITIVAGTPFTPTFSATPTTPNCLGTQVTYTATAGQTNYVWTFPGTAGVNYTLVSGGTSTSNTAVVIYNNIGSQTISMNYASPLGCASAGAVTNTITITTPTVTASATATTVCDGTPITLTGAGASTYAWTGGVTDGVAFTPTSSTTYTVTGTSAAGCTSTDAIAITVNPLPAISCPSDITVSATNGSCGEVVNFSASSSTIPAPTITYSPASGSTFNIGTTVVTATATTAEGCVSTCTFNVTVTSSGTSNWLGSISNDWFDSGNWCGGIPTATSDVEISTGAPFMPIISTTGAIAKNITINSGASLTMNGTGYLTVVGNWINNGTFTATSGDVNFNGSSSQTLTGATSFFNLDLNNSAGLTINSNVNVNGLCQLVSGILTTGSNVLQISNGAYLSSTTGYVNGYLKKYIDLADFYASFEVGSLTAYTPANISFNNVLSAGYLTVNTISSDHPSISSSGLDGTKTVNRYWNLVGSGLTFDFYDVDLTYALADKDAGFIDMYAGAKIYSGSTWNVTTPNFGTANSLSIGAVNSLGSIQIGIFNPTPVAISLSPNYGYIGLTSNIVFNGTGFVSGATSVNPVAGVTINSTTVNNDSTMTVNISVSSSAITGLRKFAITNITNAPGFGGTSDSLDFTISAHPVAAFYANRTFVKCNVSGNVDFMNNSTGGTSYFWNFGAGANPATATGNGPYTVTYSTTGLKTVKLIAYSPLGNDTLTRANYITVTSAAPLIPASISGPLNITCTSSLVTNVYSAPLLNDVSYNWIVPSGATITSGLGTSAIAVTFSGTFTSGTISLSQTNGCGTSATRSIVVTKTPSTPGVISGSTIVCGLNSATYSIAAVSGATSYTWTLPTGVTSSLGTSPIVTSATSLPVVFASTFISGTISVTADNACSSSAARTLAIGIAPSTPGVISGTTVVCGLSSTTYSIAAVSGATSYTWTLPTGVTSSLGTSPIITSLPSLYVLFAPTFISGTISVIANTACSSSAGRTLPISIAPSTPASVSGPLASCGLTSSTYTVAATSGATSYTWTLPAGITSTVGASPIVTSGTSLVVNFASTFTNGNISVTANNSCASNVARTISVSKVPSIPVAIYGNSMVCGISSSSYTIIAVSGATSYTWTLPSGVTCSLGASPITTTSTTLLLNFATSFSAGTLSLQANNSCGTSIAKTYAISRSPAMPSSISGLTSICGVSSTTYSVPAVTGATSYTWTLPTGVTSALGASPITTAATGITVNLASTFTSGSISVTANNACASSSPKTLAISNKPAAPASISGPTVVCGTASVTYTAAASAGATSYIWTLPTGVTSTLGASPITTAGTSLTVNISSTFAAGSITVNASNSCATSLAKSLSISQAPFIPGLITGPTNICALATATYSIAAVTGATSYTWSLPAGVTSALGASPITTAATSITVSIATNVATGPISVVANNACGSGAARSKSLTGCRSNNSDVQADSVNEKTIEVNVYPNPTSDNVNIEFTSNIESNLLFELYDIQGKIILSKIEIITEGQNILFYNVEELDKGIYFIKLTDEQSKMLITKKLVVQ